MVGRGDLLLRGGRVVDSVNGTDRLDDVLIRDGRITAIGPQAPSGHIRELDCRGLVVCPGFIDLHTHLRFPGLPEKETMASGTAAAAAGGFTTICTMANTRPVVDRVEVLEEVLAEAARSAVVRVRQLAAVTIGLQGEILTDIPALSAAGAVAFSDDGKPVWNDEVMARALAASSRLDAPISVHEEDPKTVRGGVANAGAIAKHLGLSEWPCRGEASMIVRDIAMVERIGGRLHVAHVSCAESVGLIRSARDRGLAVTAEVTPHHLRLTDRLLAGDVSLDLPAAHPCTKVNPPLRSEKDVESMIAALADGTIDAVATDHAPHSAADKSLPFADAAFGFSSIETALPLLLDLVRAKQLSLRRLIESLTMGPAWAFRLPGGSLSAAEWADICVFHPDEEWVLTPDRMRSKGKNTPLLGSTLRGRVRYTIVGGRVIHESR